MRWNSRTGKSKINQKYTKWHKWFAWYPVKVANEDTTVWLEYVYRKGTIKYNSYSSHEYIDYEYNLGG